MTQDSSKQGGPATPPPSEPPEGGLYMPPAPGGPGDPGGAAPLPPPPTFGKQMAQLILIPAAIVIAAIGVALLFGKIGGTRDSLGEQLSKLQQSGGSGKMAFGLQDPRYKDRWQAANNLAETIRIARRTGDYGGDPAKKNPEAQRLEINGDLIKILRDNVAQDEHDLRMFLLLALAQLGEESGLEAILSHADSPDARVREIVATASASWVELLREKNADAQPSAKLRDSLITALAKLAGDATPNVAREAVRVLGYVAGKDDGDAVAAVRRAMARDGRENRGVVWNAAIALARWGDELGSQLVAAQLLDREALSKLPAEEGVTSIRSNGRTTATPGGLMPADQQDMILATTLAATDKMSDPAVWSRVRRLAENDPNKVVRSMAQTALDRREGGR